MEENGAPLTWDKPPDAEVVDKRRADGLVRCTSCGSSKKRTGARSRERFLRREGLYSSHLTTWRKAVRSGWLRALSKRRGRKPSERNPLEGKVHKLERENTRLEKELEKPHLPGRLARRVSLSDPPAAPNS